MIITHFKNDLLRLLLQHGVDLVPISEGINCIGTSLIEPLKRSLHDYELAFQLVEQLAINNALRLLHQETWLIDIKKQNDDTLLHTLLSSLSKLSSEKQIYLLNTTKLTELVKLLSDKQLCKNYLGEMPCGIAIDSLLSRSFFPKSPLQVALEDSLFIPAVFNLTKDVLYGTKGFAPQQSVFFQKINPENPREPESIHTNDIDGVKRYLCDELNLVASLAEYDDNSLDPIRAEQLNLLTQLDGDLSERQQQVKLLPSLCFTVQEVGMLQNLLTNLQIIFSRYYQQQRHPASIAAAANQTNNKRSASPSHRVDFFGKLQAIPKDDDEDVIACASASLR